MDPAGSSFVSLHVVVGLYELCIKEFKSVSNVLVAQTWLEVGCRSLYILTLSQQLSHFKESEVCKSYEFRLTMFSDIVPFSKVNLHAFVVLGWEVPVSFVPTKSRTLLTKILI